MPGGGCSPEHHTSSRTYLPPPPVQNPPVVMCAPVIAAPVLPGVIAAPPPVSTATVAEASLVRTGSATLLHVRGLSPAPSRPGAERCVYEDVEKIRCQLRRQFSAQKGKEEEVHHDRLRDSCMSTARLAAQEKFAPEELFLPIEVSSEEDASCPMSMYVDEVPSPPKAPPEEDEAESKEEPLKEEVVEEVLKAPAWLAPEEESMYAEDPSSVASVMPADGSFAAPLAPPERPQETTIVSDTGKDPTEKYLDDDNCSPERTQPISDRWHHVSITPQWMS